MNHRIQDRPIRTALVVAILLWPSISMADYYIEAGYDLLETRPGTTFAGFPFEGVDILTYDFSSGSVFVGTTDTIVRRLGVVDTGGGPGAAPPVDIEIVSLQLKSVEPIDLGAGLGYYYATEQARRMGGAISTGTLSYIFNDDHTTPPADPVGTGTMNLDVDVHFDLRLGALDGPVVFSGKLDMTAGGVPWDHLAGVGAVKIPGVNFELNGATGHADVFHDPFIAVEPGGATHAVAPARWAGDPPWNPRDPGAATGDWEFLTPDIFIPPDGPHTDLSRTTTGGIEAGAFIGINAGREWLPGDDGDGEWSFPGGGTIDFSMDNMFHPPFDDDLIKFVDVQILYDSPDPSVRPATTDWWGDAGMFAPPITIQKLGEWLYAEKLLKERMAVRREAPQGALAD
jgi:hypothetical protein